ncbi:MAG: hypothetical protein HKN39_05980 [Flavobacteriales bacterium]|nr:hypothetical protein [Flavobacteriales bacterium]
MRITSLLIAVVFLSVTSFGQDLTSKKGENFLPEEGEWAIGFDAHPFLEYAGNLFSGGFNNAPEANYLNGVNTIYGKMFTSPTEAYRAKVRVGFNSTTNKAFSTDATDAMLTVEDSEKISSTFVGLGAGKEYRRGNTRLQGFYGGEAFLWLANSKTSYEYGNALGSSHPFHDQAFGQASGLTEAKSGSTVGVQLRGFIGAEYFVLPKISIGAEYGWGLTFASTGNGESTTEFFNVADNNVESTTTESAGGSSVSLDTDINNSMPVSGVLGDMSLKAMFHF